MEKYTIIGLSQTSDSIKSDYIDFGLFRNIGDQITKSGDNYVLHLGKSNIGGNTFKSGFGGVLVILHEDNDYYYICTLKITTSHEEQNNLSNTISIPSSIGENIKIYFYSYQFNSTAENFDYLCDENNEKLLLGSGPSVNDWLSHTSTGSNPSYTTYTTNVCPEMFYTLNKKRYYIPHFDENSNQMSE